ncbi:hypothetical protein ACHAW5_007945 [Stephanodiscus triporus]|uniref:Uncharacterized protein n=1 Tax=Stephanodiscus triporus TaxID=2934178 RepID=A0ABD3NE78_9STRA
MKLSLAVAILLPLAASSQTVLYSNPQGCIDPSKYDDDTDFFPQKFVPDVTTDYLAVEYHNTYKIVTNVLNEKSYLFYQCGTDPPVDEVSSGRHHVVLSIPHAGKVVVTETPQIPSLELLSKRSEIGAYVGEPKLVSSPCLSSLMADGVVETIYYPDDPWNQTLNDEGVAEFLAGNPDAIVLAGAFGNVDGERHIVDPQTQERTAVATFDWLGMYAAMFNLEGVANDIISKAKARYECAAENAAYLTADVPEDERPKILWAEYYDGLGWSVADCPAWDAAYYCEYAHHCEASIVSRPEGVGFSESFGGTEEYWYLTDDEFLMLGKDVETWVYPSPTFGDVYAMKAEILDQFVSVRNGRVYDTQGQGPYGWYEQRLAEYDVVVLDVCSIVGTASPAVMHDRRWLRSYFTEAIGSPGTCDDGDVFAAWVPAEARCDPIATTTSDDQTGPSPADPVATSAAFSIVGFVPATVVAWIASIFLA